MFFVWAISLIFIINILKGTSIINASISFTTRSPKASEIQGIPVPRNEIEKNKKVSINEPKKDDVIGATNHFLFLRTWKISTSINWATIKAIPDPIAILIEIKSWKLVDTNSVNNIPKVKPK